MKENRGTVERVVRLICYLPSAHERVGIKHIADQLRLPQSTTHRLVRQLISLGLMQRVKGTRQYELGPEMYRLGALIWNRTNIVQLAMPALERIAERTKEGCALGVYREADHTLSFAAQVESPQALHYRIDLFNPVSVVWGASGRSVLAFLAPELVEALFKSSRRSPTGLPPPNLKDLEKELALIRKRGYSTSQRGERVPGASGVSAPIRGPNGRVLGCLSLTIPSVRYTRRREAELAQVLLTEAAQLSGMLGAC